MSDGLRALIVCQMMEQRVRLQHLLEHAHEFKEVVSAHSLSEASLLCSTTGPWDAAFVSDRFADEDCGPFIEQVKAGLSGTDCALIRLCSRPNMDKDAVANSMILGFHGFVCTPYSFEDLLEAVTLAKGVKLQGSKLRLKAATGLMLADTFAEGSDNPTADTWQKVRNSWDNYKAATGQSLTLSVVDALHQLSPAKRLSGYRYNGVSERVRRLFKKREL